MIRRKYYLKLTMHISSGKQVSSHTLVREFTSIFPHKQRWLAEMILSVTQQYCWPKERIIVKEFSRI